MRIIAVLVVGVMVFGVVQSLAAWAGVNDSGVLGVLPRVAGVVAGGIAGYFAGGVLGAVAGAGFMVVINPSSGCPSCQDSWSPIVY